jgi:hypothetical protein
VKYFEVLITPEEVDAISNVVASFKQVEFDEFTDSDAAVVHKWVSYVKHVLFNKWADLEDGDHMKEAYRDEVWSWTDNDLYGEDK